MDDDVILNYVLLKYKLSSTATAIKAMVRRYSSIKMKPCFLNTESNNSCHDFAAQFVSSLPC